MNLIKLPYTANPLADNGLSGRDATTRYLLYNLDRFYVLCPCMEQSVCKLYSIGDDEPISVLGSM